MGIDMATRRGFLAGLLVSGALPRLAWADVGAPAFLAAAKDAAGEYALHALSAKGESLFHLPLPGRGHAACAHPVRAEAVAFARRPGTFALVLDAGTGRELARLTPPEGRQFNGHGAYSADGSVLYTSEVIAAGSAGRVGLWDSESWARIGEWDSGGIGPHELRLTPDGGLVVANGGIETDPEDRTKLNIDGMRSNLTWLDGTGTVVAQAALGTELHQNSIRHLALGPNGEVAFAMQWEGDLAEAVPLLGICATGQSPALCPALEAEALLMQGYAGSIAWNRAAGRIAITSPRGGVAMVFDAAGQPVASHRRADICGAAALGDGFVLTDGSGAVWAAGEAGMTLLAQHPLSWDNHLVALQRA
jgi:uncharacterized protein